MHSKIFMMLTFIIIGGASMAFTANRASAGWNAATQDKADPISGEWLAPFEVEGNSVPVKFVFKLEGEKLTGTVESAHTGPGKIRVGSFINNELKFTLDFEKHESIDVTGTLRGGKLSGEFRTEGRVGTWHAAKS